MGHTWGLWVQVVWAGLVWVAIRSGEGCVHADDIAVFAGLDSFGTVSLSCTCVEAKGGQNMDLKPQTI